MDTEINFDNDRKSLIFDTHVDTHICNFFDIIRLIYVEEPCIKIPAVRAVMRHGGRTDCLLYFNAGVNLKNKRASTRENACRGTRLSMLRKIDFNAGENLKSKRASTRENACRGTRLVGVTGFEPAASTSQMSRATNCATPR